MRPIILLLVNLPQKPFHSFRNSPPISGSLIFVHPTELHTWGNYYEPEEGGGGRERMLHLTGTVLCHTVGYCIFRIALHGSGLHDSLRG